MAEDIIRPVRSADLNIPQWISSFNYSLKIKIFQKSIIMCSDALWHNDTLYACLLKCYHPKLMSIRSFELESELTLGHTHLRLSHIFEVFICSGASVCAQPFLRTIRVLQRAVAKTSHSSALFALLMTKHYTASPVFTLLTLRIDRGSRCLLYKVIRPVWVFSGIFFHYFQFWNTHIHSAVNKCIKSWLICGYYLCIFHHVLFFFCFYHILQV